MYLLDTDIIIWISRNRKDILEVINKLATNSPTAVSTISIAEVYAGILPTEITLTEKFFSEQEILPVDREIAVQGGYYRQMFGKKYQKLNLADCLIAATAKLHNATVLTLNTRHYPMTDVKILNPLKN